MPETIDVDVVSDNNGNSGRSQVCCPNCGSTQLQITSKVFNPGCGCIGLLLFGWWGLLLGLLGLSEKEVVCLNCGSRWPVGKSNCATRQGGCGCLSVILIAIIVIALI